MTMSLKASPSDTLSLPLPREGAGRSGGNRLWYECHDRPDPLPRHIGMRATALALALFSSLPGCTVGPDYRAPDPMPPERWKAARDPAAALRPVSERTLKTWWTTFNDPKLNRLMAQAGSGNLDLKIAYSRIEQARAERRANRADLFPRISADAVAARVDNLLPFGGQASQPFNFFLTGFDAVWEIDVFGRLRRKLEAATAQTDAATEDYREAWVILSSELARNYTEYRSLQNQQCITRANLAAQQKTLALTEQLYREGLAAYYETERAQSQVAATAARIPALEGQLASAQHRIEILIGAKPGGLDTKLAEPSEVPSSDVRGLLTTPAETLRYRPDVRRAERNLAAATATQGAAFAELFPKISVAAFLGLHNSDLENLFRSSSFAWASGSSITQPLFNFGRIRAGIDLADARQQQAYINYEKVVLEALHETETAMKQFLTEEQRRANLARSVIHLEKALEQADLRYREGLATFLEVLDAQRAVYAEQLAQAQSQAQTTTNLIALYKALGGAGQLEVKPVDDPIRPLG